MVKTMVVLMPVKGFAVAIEKEPLLVNVVVGVMEWDV
jgi:hypothetical protein